MKRRVFLKAGTLAGIGLTLSKTGIFPSKIAALAEPSISDLLMTGMIWTNQSDPVPLRKGGSASSISGPTNSTSLSNAEADLHAVFIRELALPQVPTRMEMHLFAYTRYRLYVNGNYVGRGPSRFQNERPEYDSREIARFLVPGRNRISVLVHRDAPTGRVMEHDPGFAALLEWDGGGSTQIRMVTDTTWRAKSDLSFGPRLKAWASIEENIDTMRGEDWASSDHDASSWPFSVLVLRDAKFFPLEPRTTPLQLEKLRQWTSGPTDLLLHLNAGEEVILELDEIVQGYHLLEFEADGGTELQVSYLLPENQNSGKCTYLARSGVQTYIGGDTFAFNRLSLHLKSGKAHIRKAQAFEVRYPFERVGEFESSDPFLNQLWKICARSVELLSEDSYVDCADRERVEWIDDSPPAFDCTRTMMAGPEIDGKRQWSDARLLKAMLRRVGLTQLESGQIKAHTCSERWDIHAIMEDRSCDWIIQLREYFDSTGDEQFLRELWPRVVRLLNWFLARRTPRGLVLAREWEVWDNPLIYQFCEGAGLNAFVYRALRDASYLGLIIGKRADTDALTTAADQLAHAYNSLLWDAKEGTYYGALFGEGSKVNPRLDGSVFPGPILEGRYQPTAQAALFSIYSGIVPADRLSSVQQWILAHTGGVTGPMSHYYLFHALYGLRDPKHDAQVLDLMRSGWKLQVESPWQTTWEDLVDRSGSKAHMYGMVPGFFLSAYVLGIRREQPIVKKSIVLEPRPGNLSSAQGVVVTEFGLVPVSWTRNNEAEMSVEFTSPLGVRTTVRLPQRNDDRTIVVDGLVQQAEVLTPYLSVGLGEGHHIVKHYRRATNP